MHLTLVPFIQAASELKTKATQHSVRSCAPSASSPTSCSVAPTKEHPLTPSIKAKIALFCDVEEEAVISARDVDSIYEVPLAFHDRVWTAVVVQAPRVCAERPTDLSRWEEIGPADQVAPAPRRASGWWASTSTSKDSYKSLYRGASPTAASPTRRRVDVVWVDAERIERDGLPRHVETGLDGILVPGGFGDRGIEGKIAGDALRA